MARGRRDGILIAGGGLSGSLVALALTRYRPELPFLIVEESARFGGAGATIFADAEADEGAELLAPLIAERWPGFYLAWPGTSRKLKLPMSGFGAGDVHEAMTSALDPRRYRLGTKVVAVREDALVLDGGETIKAEGAIDARGAASLSPLELLYEARLERDYRFRAPHRVDRPVLIDATVPQGPGLRYFQCVPLSAERLLVADICISERAQPDEGAGARLAAYVKARGWDRPRSGGEQSASRPLPIGGDFDAFWRLGGARAAKLGRRGGFGHPFTGRAIGDATAMALLIAQQRDVSGAALHDLVEAEAKRLWKRRENLRGIAAALARAPAAARPAIAERVYGLEQAALERLFADRLGLLDRSRIARALRS